MNWRENFNNDSVLRQRVDNRIRERLYSAAIKGRAKYGSDFVGDPLEQAFEEACDLMFYLATEIERRAKGEQA